MLPPEYLSALKIIAEKFKGRNYCVRGTTSLLLQGYDMGVDDIDILTDRETALNTNEFFREYLTDEVKFAESDKFKSFYGKFSIGGLSGEIYGDWEIKEPKGIWTKKYTSSDRINIALEDFNIFVTPGSLELEFYARMGRWGAYQKLKKQIKMDKLLLIDTYNFLHRAYHALPTSFRDERGEPTNAVYGVTSMLINVISQVKPNYIIAALDTPEATFRIEDFTGYKAHRKPMESDLESQIPKVAEVLDAFGIKSIAVNGYEADDVIATVVEKIGGKTEVIIISNDRDLWQLAGKSTHILLPNTRGETEWLGPSEVVARLGFSADKIADYKGLRGDPSDNIPGVYGVGEKTATALIQKYGSLEELYKNAESVTPPSLREKLLNSYEQALMSKKLASLIRDVPFSFELSECKYSETNKLRVKKVLEKYNFKSLIKRMGFAPDNAGRKDTDSGESDGQLTLI